jgi:hypothetical protein
MHDFFTAKYNTVGIVFSVAIPGQPCLITGGYVVTCGQGKWAWTIMDPQKWSLPRLDMFSMIQPSFF